MPVASPTSIFALQAAVRGRRHRLHFITARSAAVCVQAVWRGTCQRMHARRQQVCSPDVLCCSQL